MISWRFYDILPLPTSKGLTVTEQRQQKNPLIRAPFYGTQRRRRPVGGRKNHAEGGNAQTIPHAGGKSLLHLPTRYPAGTTARRSFKLRQ